MTQRKLTGIPGPIFGLGTALLFGTSTPLAKLFLAQVQPWMLAGLMFLGGGLGLVPIYLIRNWIHRPTANLQPGDWGYLGASVLAGGIIAPVLLTVGLANTPATAASLLLNFEAVFTALLAWTVFREQWRTPVFFGIVAITAGGIMLSHTQHSQVGLSWGALAILGTCFLWATDSNFTNKVADRDPLQVALLKSGVAGSINVVIALLLGQPLPPLPTLLAVLGLGFLGYGLTLVCFVLALRHLGASRTGAYLALSPFTGAAIAAMFLGEQITQSLAIAAILMAIGVGLCATKPDENAQSLR